MDMQLKKVFYALGIALSICLIFGLIGWGSLKFIEAKNLYSQNRTITLTSTGKVTVIPDIATVSFDIVKEGKQVSDISNETNKAMQAVIDYLKKEGVNSKDIKTSQYNISQTYEDKCVYGTEATTSSIYPPSKTCSSKVSGYKITQSVSVKIRDFKKIDAIIGNLTSLGVNQMSNLNFGIDDSEVLQNQAKIEAINQIKEKAKILSASTGIRLGRIIAINEANSYGYGGYGYADSAMLKSSIPASVPAPIEPGSQDVSQTVSITYEIK